MGLQNEGSFFKIMGTDKLPKMLTFILIKEKQINFKSMKISALIKKKHESIKAIKVGWFLFFFSLVLGQSPSYKIIKKKKGGDSIAEEWSLQGFNRKLIFSTN